MIQLGTTVAPFTSTDEDGKPFDSSELDGGWYLLYWYPKADTPGCTAQAQGLRDQIEAFDELGCTVLGASFDEPSDNQAFRASHRLPFRLLSDTDRSLALALGIVDDAGETYAPRVAILVDDAAVVRERYEVEDPEFFAERVLDDLEEHLDP